MLFGHEDKIKLFKDLHKKNALGQAYLFFGDPQIGKHYFAHHLAHFIEHGKFKILERALVDAVFISTKDGKKTIGINDIREIKDFLHQKPIASSKRLVVIDEAHRLTSQAQASLLKFVEEAPEHITFIFITSDSKSLISPLASRLQKVYFSRLHTKKLKKILSEKYNISSKKSEKISKKSFGRLGKALDLIDGEQYNDDDLEEFINHEIVSLFLKDKIKNSKVLKWLNDKSVKIKRYSINPKLQRKVIEAKLKK